MSWKKKAKARAALQKEIGFILKDWGGKIPIALVYPNTYYIGMSSLGFQTVYRLFNAEKDVVCERAFADPLFMDEAGPISLESQRPMADFAVVAFSIPYELDYFNVLEVLRRSSIPLFSADRGEGDALVIAGGPAVSANPEPMALFVDAFVVGEGEEVVPELVAVLREIPLVSRHELLEALKRIRGIYVPLLHSPSEPPVVRRWVQNLDLYPVHSVVLTEETEFGGMYLVEIERGCGRDCRFCLARCIYPPLRERSVDPILAQARQGLNWRKTIGLVGFAVSDYSKMDELLDGLMALGAGISTSSLRAESVTDKLIKAIAQSSATITLAPEAGSFALRRIIGKPIPEDDILRVAELAGKYGVRRIKLYFMIGLPRESEEDVKAIGKLVAEVLKRFEGELVVNISPFVPKPHTPFQRIGMASEEELEERLRLLRRLLGRLKVKVRAESPAWAMVQAILSRGDRNIGLALAEIAKSGEKVTPSRWEKALEKEGLDKGKYLGPWPRKEPTPWEKVVRI
jgi:radical SAM superfamily enzyme YgiQ (UPF0313 family)